MSQEIPTLKLLLIGSTNVGKSSLLLRFIDNEFLPQEEMSATIGVDFKLHMMEVDGQKYKLTIWDTAGQERFRTLTSSYYRGAQGVVLVYDVSRRETFNDLDTWWKEVNTYCSSPHVVKMIIGNKVDKESTRVVEYKEGEELARRLQTLFLECSAKSNIGVEEAFEELVTKIIETPSLWQKQTATSPTLRVTDDDQETIDSSTCSC
ncbi:unnamed protein product [Absidia cylindrospora]